MIAAFDYDVSYIPAMPVVEVEIRQAIDAPGILLHAIVDSGADGTLIPIQYLEQIQADKGDETWLRGVARSRALVDLYWIWLQMGDHRPLYIEVVADTESDEAILGRDVLNQFIVTLNGLASVVEISD